MRNKIFSVCILISLGILGGCGHSNQQSVSNQQSTAMTTPPSQPAPNQAVTTNNGEPSDTVAQVTSAVDTVISQQESATYPFLPKGTKLKHAVVSQGTATLDFNSKFSALANMGDTTESQAQDALRQALAPITAVKKMSVTVDGKPFQSQMTDWTTPFNVRKMTGDSSSSSASN